MAEAEEGLTPREEAMMAIVESLDREMEKMRARHRSILTNYWLVIAIVFQGGMTFGIIITRAWWGL